MTQFYDKFISPVAVQEQQRLNDLLRRDRRRRQREHPLPPHIVAAPYFCGCVSCECWREARVEPGQLVRPATQDPTKTTPGTVPFWRPNDWRSSGWNLRMEDNGIDLLLVVGDVDDADRTNGGHLSCCVVVAMGSNRLIKQFAGPLVTSKKWLVVV